MKNKELCPDCYTEMTEQKYQDITGEEYDVIMGCKFCGTLQLTTLFTKKQKEAILKKKRSEILNSTERYHFYIAKHRYISVKDLMKFQRKLDDIFKDRQKKKKPD